MKEALAGGFLRQEQSASQFQRSFKLPENVKAKEVKASYKDGLLTVTLPWSRELKQANRDIAIN
jgi:HSP20 family protein